MTINNLVELPARVDILTEIYNPLPDPTSIVDWDGLDASAIADHMLESFSDALRRGNRDSLGRTFLRNGSYWRDTLSLTSHLRTFKNSHSIAAALLNLNGQRFINKISPIRDSSQGVGACGALKWIETLFTFSTNIPKAVCSGRMMLLPESEGNGLVSWKIWTLATWLIDFVEYPEKEALLRMPSAPIDETGPLQTDVLIVGGGNAGLLLAARLKTLNVKFLVIDKNDNVGDNWLLRYECLRFHVGKSFCEMPYLPYPEEVGDGPRRNELASQLKRFAAEFDLRVLHRTVIKSTNFDSDGNQWHLRLSSNDTERTLSTRHLVLATGAGFQGPHLPSIPGREVYKGVNIHSAAYKNAALLSKQNAKSVLIIGSANTAFDVMEDCYNAGLRATMIQRSPTYVIPMSYLLHPTSLGLYDSAPATIADAIAQAGPLAVSGQLLGLAHAMQAAEEPDRYANLCSAGFQLRNCTEADLTAHLIERCGGHFVEIGSGVELLASGKVQVRSGVRPVSYTPHGLQLSDGSTVDADAIVWCTGFGSTDIRHSLAGILGDGFSAIQTKMDATWGVDSEGEVRGLWKRQPNVDNFWVFAGGAHQHRWYSKVLALQIKGALEGILPDAYRDSHASIIHEQE